MTNQPSSLQRSIEDAIESRADVGGAVLGADISAQQLDLMRVDGKLPGNVFQLVRQSPEVRTGPGRRPGSRNKVNDKIGKLVSERYGDAVLAMADLAFKPMDQLIELILIADSTAEREERLLGLIDRAEKMIDAVLDKATRALIEPKVISELTNMLERVFDAAKSLKMKPGDLAIKALNLQLAALRTVAEYQHKKLPVEANINVNADAVLVMPGGGMAGSFEQKDADTRLAADLIAKMLSEGRIEAQQLEGYRLQDGQLVEADWSDVPEGDGGAE